MKAVTLVLLLGTARADWPDWQAHDTVLQGAVLTMLALDYGQTAYGSQRRYYESNPLLGRFPSRGDINLYFGACALFHTGVAVLLPRPYRTIWQGVWIGMELGAIHQNSVVQGGLHFEW